ncbi:MAG TPA: NAD(P)/FAD-dependent oxidoreductase [Bacteroidales bacterium]|nr:NAD(P)/FAD-dependent oxidoreductase [Bacteroidales bacterium]
MYLQNIPETGQKRIVIAGAGFGGLKLATHLAGSNFQVVLLDKNNYHSFQPLFYQIATAGIEPSAVSFPLRKAFQNYRNIHVRMARVKKVNPEQQELETNIGNLHYDYLVIAMGAANNFFGNTSIAKYSLPMKSTGESLGLRNTILNNFEKALNLTDVCDQASYMNIVVVGGGPTGVEVSGALAEMKRHVLPKDYPELDFKNMHIHLVEGGKKLLGGMSQTASEKVLTYLRRFGVNVILGKTVTNYDGLTVTLSDNSVIQARTLIWAAGIRGHNIEGLDEKTKVRGNRIEVDAYNRVTGYENIFAIGDISLMKTEDYPNGHPQVAQVAIQQAKNLARNFKRMNENKDAKPFSYLDLGTLATVGRNKAVVDLHYLKFHGLLAWFFWMFIHLMAIVGVKNRFLIFINWVYNYFTYDQSLRLIIKPKIREDLV